MALPDGHKAERVRVYGRVQGVWYRRWTVDQAIRRGLTGWVRNRRDGRHIHYRLDDDHVRMVLEVSRAHVAHTGEIR